ncbi:MAG: EutN/CcmL family microcompartment protein [Phycisphaerae bacterium]
MQLARVIGSVVSTRKEASMTGLKFLLVRPLDEAGQEIGSPLVAVDAVDAGLHEVVLFATGSSARQTEATRDRPCDAVIMGIVDSWDVMGERKYKK